jgi:hypothetical protein
MFHTSPIAAHTLLRHRILAPQGPDSLNVRSPISRFLMISGRDAGQGYGVQDIRRLSWTSRRLVARRTGAQVIMVALGRTRSTMCWSRNHRRSGTAGPAVRRSRSVTRRHRGITASISTSIPGGASPRHGVTQRYLARRLAAQREHVTRRFASTGSMPFTPVHLHGRHVIDTYQQFSGWIPGALTSYGLNRDSRS